MKVLIIGGYGTFGGRLARLLADEPRLTIIVAGRSFEAARAFCAPPAQATLVPLLFDREGDIDAQLCALAPDIVVDASGPFQNYGDPWRVVRAALARKIHYLDLADGADFVKGIARFNDEARIRGIFVLSGVSSFPVLTAAVIRRLATGLPQIDSISGGIAPSPYAGVGLNVIRAIASYSGQPVRLMRDGRPKLAYALTESRRYTIAPPGCLPLRNIRFSLVDVPDLVMLPGLWPALRDIWVGVGPVPEILHRALNGCAWMVRARLLPSLLPIARLMHRTINVLRWGEHRGGMFVEIKAGSVVRSWHMVAEGDDGPLIPSMACEAIVRRCLDGKQPASGARAATGELELDDYDELFARRAIHTGIREVTPDTASLPLYRRLLGDAYNLLAAPLQEMHDLKRDITAEGIATVTRGDGFLARLVGAIVGFPQPGENIPVRVGFKLENGRERWRRTFAGRSFHSTQEQGRGRFEWLLCERFGAVNAGMALTIEDGRLRLIVRRWSFLGIPMPLVLAPHGDAYEYAENGRFHFHVDIRHRLTGLIVAYRGWLVPR